MNLLVRFKNPIFLMTFIPFVLSFIYQVMSMFDYVPKVSENSILELVTHIVNALGALGILVDPTTVGVGDSANAMSYEEPK